MNFKESGHEDVDWIHVAQVRKLADSCEHGNETFSFILSRNFLAS